MSQSSNYIGNQFLKVIAEMAHGSLSKSFDFSSIWEKTGITSIDNEEYVVNRILSEFTKKNLIIETGKGKFKITRRGIYHVSSYFKIPANTLGYLSREELVWASNRYLKIYDKLRRQGMKKISTADIHRDGLGGFTLRSIYQVAEYLEEIGRIKRTKSPGKIKWILQPFTLTKNPK
jgi:hypothetical protein